MVENSISYYNPVVLQMNRLWDSEAGKRVDNMMSTSQANFQACLFCSTELQTSQTDQIVQQLTEDVQNADVYVLHNSNEFYEFLTVAMCFVNCNCFELQSKFILNSLTFITSIRISKAITTCCTYYTL